MSLGFVSRSRHLCAFGLQFNLALSGFFSRHSGFPPASKLDQKWSYIWSDGPPGNQWLTHGLKRQTDCWQKESPKMSLNFAVLRRYQLKTTGYHCVHQKSFNSLVHMQDHTKQQRQPLSKCLSVLSDESNPPFPVHVDMDYNKPQQDYRELTENQSTITHPLLQLTTVAGTACHKVLFIANYHFSIVYAC